MSSPSPQHAHLDDARLQRLADGSLRGPEGLAAREQIDACEECSGAVEMYRSLLGQLDALVDPPAPPDFTLQVMDAVSAHNEQLAARRHIHLAAIPAVLVAVLAVLGWTFSAGPERRLDELVRGFTLCRQVLGAAQPALEVARLPLAGGALLACIAVGVVLLRALRLPRNEGSNGVVSQ